MNDDNLAPVNGSSRYGLILVLNRFTRSANPWALTLSANLLSRIFSMALVYLSWSLRSTASFDLALIARNIAMPS